MWAGANAIKREREKRASRCGAGAQPLPTLTREQLKPPKQSYALTYFNVGVSFFLLGTFMILTSVIPDNYLGSNWTSLIPFGCLFIILGIIMVTINQVQTRSEEKHLEEYVKLRLGKSSSGAPLVRTPTIHIDVPSNPEKSDFEEQLLNKNGLNGESSV